MKRRHSSDPDPFAVLGLTAGAAIDEVVEARRRLAKSAHPDVGGTLAEMQRINAAAEAALSLLGTTTSSISDRPHSAEEHQPTASPSYSGRPRHDHRSFTIEVLPAEAFEGLLVVASWLGDVISDDPPYGLEIALVDPVRGWCRLDLVPDAGASTVSLSVAGEPGYPLPGVDRVRDLWVEGLNRLDWGSGNDAPTADRSGPTP